MNRGLTIFIGAFGAFVVSGFLFLLNPQLQVGQQTFTTVLGSTEVWPKAPSGLAVQGAEVYRAEGCAYCHSQQVRQREVLFAGKLAVADRGTNFAAVAAVAQKYGFKIFDDAKVGTTYFSLPHNNVAAETAVKDFAAAGAKISVEISPFGPDIKRGWGLRRSVAADYLFASPPLPGSQRIGPDLANLGLRLPDANWQLLHLYHPQTEVAGSAMPPYRFLFETRKIIFNRLSPDALALTGKFAPPAGYEVVPTDAARALVAYLQSLRADAPLFEAPMSK